MNAATPQSPRLDLLVRRMLPQEQSLVLATWKHSLRETRSDWKKGLRDSDFWLLVNFVLDKITLPTCEVWMGCHPSLPETPECWIAIRKLPGLSTWRILHLYSRTSIKKDPELGAALERELLSTLGKDRPIAPDRPTFNPFKELKT